MTVFERYIEARKKLKITQTEIAKGVGVTQGTISQQDALGNVSIDALSYISKTYNIDMNWVFTGEGAMTKSVLAGKTLRELEDEIMRLQTLAEDFEDQVLMLVREKKELERRLENKTG